MRRIPMLLALLGTAAIAGHAVFAADPPDRVNYQGVLRDAAGAPRNGAFDMTFRFFDASIGGNEILVDKHHASGTGAVVVSNGLFDVSLGGGSVGDGSAALPGDPYTTLAAVFRDFGAVWMEIAVGAELLSPRVRVQSTPYALHSKRAVSAASADTAATAADATTLGGRAASGYLNTSSTAQTKSGGLTVGDFAANGSFEVRGNTLKFGVPGASMWADATTLGLTAGEADTDDLRLFAGNDLLDGGAWFDGLGNAGFVSGDGNYYFHKGGAGISTLGRIFPDGDLTMTGDIRTDTGKLYLGGISRSIEAFDSGLATLRIQAGVTSTDTMELKAGLGAITLKGSGDLNLKSAGGNIEFRTSILHEASLDPNGLFTVEELKVRADSGSGGNIDVGSGRVTSFSSQLQVVAGGATDSLFLLAGDGVERGGVVIVADGGMEIQHDAGDVRFLNQAFAQTAKVSNFGRVTATEDLVAEGNEVHLGAPGSVRFVRNPTNDDVWIARDEDNNHAASTFSIFTNVGERQMQINDGPDAPTFFDGNVNANGLDYAEAFWITDPSLEAGEVVMFDPEHPGYVARSAEAYSTRLAGVISTQPGFVTGGSFNAEEETDPALAQEMKRAIAAQEHDTAKDLMLVLQQKRQERQRPVALAGRLPVKVDATYGAIQAGDHLTSSPTPGHAMVMQEAGPSIGVALEGFDGKKTGTILAFVQRGHYTPTSLITETREAQAQLADAVAARTPDPASGVQVMPANLQVVLDASGGEEARFSVFRDGQAGEPRSEVFRVDERGDVWAQGAFRPRSMDVAEAFRISEPVEPGDVLVVDRDRPGMYAKSREAADPAVVGVVASDPGVLLGGDMSRLLNESPDLVEALATARRSNDREAERDVWAEVERRFKAAHASVALTGTVLVKVDATYGAIRPGDALVASPTAGRAMRAAEPAAGNTVIGKALDAFEGGAGTIRMLVMLR